MLSFTLNGQPQNVEVDPRLSTLDLLREHLGISSLKAGCAPQGLCGCCLVLINGQPRLSCTLPNKSLAGKEVQTQEGISEDKRNLLASCFASCSATACGYCTPGILTHASALLTTKPELTEEELKKSLNLHLCRCTGYSSIVDAVQQAAAVLRGEAEAPRLSESALDAPRGEKIFVDDLVVPGMLAGVLVFPPAGLGKIRRLDSAAIRAEAGVLAVV
ncbi:MAG TPA: 2Fe-2S iron-sulfur cluster-binding protein, partial [Myxococcota bacterium]|nr:2Fe-2S iron-sulfur cluster-binding protein [Myxococcota bacterium]